MVLQWHVDQCCVGADPFIAAHADVLLPRAVVGVGAEECYDLGIDDRQF